MKLSNVLRISISLLAVPSVLLLIIAPTLLVDFMAGSLVETNSTGSTSFHLGMRILTYATPISSILVTLALSHLIQRETRANMYASLFLLVAILSSIWIRLSESAALTKIASGVDVYPELLQDELAKTLLLRWIACCLATIATLTATYNAWHYTRSSVAGTMDSSPNIVSRAIFGICAISTVALQSISALSAKTAWDSNTSPDETVAVFSSTLKTVEYSFVALLPLLGLAVWPSIRCILKSRSNRAPLTEVNISDTE